ncbi:TonB-dependent receptor [Novosphingobium bradum]|uniref:TonB-dependent receptor n=1 Tax=Novosphingobium bradum TaxID=1737444 RepID=A0ABV7IP17_9SPHN
MGGLRSSSALTLIASAALAVSVSGAAHAQDAAAAPAEASDAAQGGIAEITVVATRRAESAQKVPIAVTAVSAEMIDRFKILRPEDLSRLSPGLAAVPYAGTAVSTFSIRGVGQADAAEHEEQPVAIYQDGVYVANSAASGFPIYDVHGSEVLRGPQGTLFGRNATGGVIQFLSNQPEAGTSGAIEAAIGDYDAHRFQGFLNVGNDRLAARAAFYSSTRDGFIKNLNGPDLASENVISGRLQIKYRPDELTNITLRAEGWRARGTSYSGGNPTPAYYGPNGYPVIMGATQNFYGTGAGKDLYGYRNVDGNFTQSVNDPGLIYKRIWTVAATATREVGDITLYSITSYAKSLVNYREDTDGSPLFQTTYKDGADAHTITQELRAAKNAGALRWTGGVYLFEVSGKYYTQYNLPTFCDPSSPTVCSAIGAASTVLPLDAVNGKGASMQTDYTLRTRSYAVFGQADYDITDKLTATLGARYSIDDQDYTYKATCVQTVTNACTAIYGVGTVPGIVSGLGLISLSQNSKDWSGKAGLSYKITPDSMIYASYSKGLKSGGYSTATDGFVFPGQLSFKPETLYASEIGFKNKLFDRRLILNLSAFHYTYHDFQTFQFSGVSFSVVNKDAYATGGEIEITALPTPSLTLNANIAYNDFWVKGIVTPNAPGGERQRAINAPKWTGSFSATKTFDLPNDWTLSLGYNARYTGSRYFGIVNSAINFGSSFVIQDVNVTLESKNGVTVSAYVNNVANKVYQTIAFDQTFNGYQLAHYGLPRTFGLSAKYAF